MKIHTENPIRCALLSVSDKAGLVELAKFLASKNIELVSTGGTYKTLKEAGLNVTEVSSITGFPEIMDGRVKTLHPKIHGGLLADRDKDDHVKALQQHDIAPIDLVVVNLYPFAKTIASNADYQTCVENIDIGGPAMVRASAKNHAHVTIIVDPADYEFLQGEMTEENGATSFEFRQMMAAKAYGHTAYYDALVARWLSGETGEELPSYLSFAGIKKQDLRYGENPHQNAAFYLDGSNRPGIATATQLAGKELSYNNLNDTDAAFELVAEFDTPTIAIIKHANPCGVASANNLSDAYDLALRCDPVSAFGGIIAMNRTLDAATAEKISKLFAEVIIAPDMDEDAKALLMAKKNLRLLVTGAMPKSDDKGLIVKSLAGGLLVQSRDNGRVAEQDLKIVTKRAPTAKEMQDLLFAWRVAKHVKSNAIVYAKEGATVGIGAGQMSRVDSSRIAAWKAQEAAKTTGVTETLAKGSVVASDAFFPFADGLLAAAEAGATAIIQPGGSMRDQEVIDAADEKNLAMVFTGMRHFRH